MSKSQFGFAVGFAVAAVWAMTSFLVTVAVVASGLLGYVVVRAVESSPEAMDVLDRLLPRRQ